MLMNLLRFPSELSAHRAWCVASRETQPDNTMQARASPNELLTSMQDWGDTVFSHQIQTVKITLIFVFFKK